MTVGRPPRFSKKEEIITLFEEYQKKCSDDKKIMTKAGLMVQLDIGKDLYSDYRKKPEFTDSIRKIDGLIEDQWLQRLTATGATGAIFYLKNAFKEDYKDRTESDVTVHTPKPLLDVLHNNNGDKEAVKAQ